MLEKLQVLVNIDNQNYPRFFLKMKKIMIIVTYTTNLTLLINGTMIHFYLGLSINKHIIISKPNSIINIWPNIQFIIIEYGRLHFACHNTLKITKNKM
jgi:hypothetical protein